MLKSVCCFVFISAVILAVHSQNASSSNTLDVGVSSGKGLLASVNDETDVKNKDAAIPETGKGLLASANNVTDLKNEDAAIPEPGKGLQAIVNNQTILNPGGETNTDVVQKNESPAKEQNKKVDSKVENINPGTGNIPFGKNLQNIMLKSL